MLYPEKQHASKKEINRCKNIISRRENMNWAIKHVSVGTEKMTMIQAKRGKYKVYEETTHA